MMLGPHQRDVVKIVLITQTPVVYITLDLGNRIILMFEINLVPINLVPGTMALFALKDGGKYITSFMVT